MQDKVRFSRLYWQCRRGMLELDTILTPFLEQHFSTLSKQLQADFECLLSCTDQELYFWFLGKAKPDDVRLCGIINEILHRGHSPTLP